MLAAPPSAANDSTTEYSGELGVFLKTALRTTGVFDTAGLLVFG